MRGNAFASFRRCAAAVTRSYTSAVRLAVRSTENAEARARPAIEKRVPADKRIEIGEEDALSFACNAVNVDDAVIVNRATAGFVKALGRKGFDVIQTPLSEFMKAGGSAKCLTLRLDEP